MASLRLCVSAGGSVHLEYIPLELSVTDADGNSCSVVLDTRETASLAERLMRYVSYTLARESNAE